MYARSRFLKFYLPLLIKQASTIIGTSTAILGVVGGSVLGLNIPRWLWLVIFGIGLVVAQFEIFFKTRQTTTEYDPMPFWARQSINAQGGGTWLVVILFGKVAEKLPLPSKVYTRLVEAVASWFRIDKDLLFHRSFNGGVQLRLPKDTMTPPDFDVMVGVDDGIAALQVVRTNSDDPLHIGWVMTQIEDIVRFCLSDASHDWVKKRRRQIRISLSNWPDKGITVDGLFNVKRFSDQWPRGFRLPLDYAVGKGSDPWRIAKLYASAVLSEAGYVGFEDEVAKVSSKDCLKFRDRPVKAEVAR